MKYCTGCGNALKPDENYCVGCSRVVPQQEVQDRSTNPTVPTTATDPAAGGGMHRNAGRIAAIIVLAGFMLPYVSCQGFGGRQVVTGVELASNGASGLWIIPISMVIALGLSLGVSRTAQDLLMVANAKIAAGLASSVVLLYYYARLGGVGERDELGLGGLARQACSIEVGAVLSLLGSVGLAVTGFLHRQSAMQTPEAGPGKGQSRPIPDSDQVAGR